MKERNKILIIDDELKLLKLIKILLKRFEYEIDTAEDGVEGLSKILLNEYNLIICDINMPKMNGIEVLKEARKRGCQKDFVFFTGHGNRELMMESLKYGARGFIDKPHFENLKEIVNSIMKEDFSNNLDIFKKSS